MWKPWAVAQLVGSLSHEGAVANARSAATQLSRMRVERVEIELYVAQRAAQRIEADRRSNPPDPHPGGHARRPAASLSAVNQPATSDRPSPGRRVVIAEDETLIRMDLAEMLGEEGYDVVGQAGDGARAVELAEELRPDLVIVDVKMPVLDGIAAAERIAGSGSRRW